MKQYLVVNSKRTYAAVMFTSNPSAYDIAVPVRSMNHRQIVEESRAILLTLGYRMVTYNYAAEPTFQIEELTA